MGFYFEFNTWLATLYIELRQGNATRHCVHVHHCEEVVNMPAQELKIKELSDPWYIPYQTPML